MVSFACCMPSTWVRECTPLAFKGICTYASLGVLRHHCYLPSEEGSNVASGESSKASSPRAWGAGHLTELQGFFQSSRAHHSATHEPLLLPELTGAATPSDSVLQNPPFPFLFIYSLLPPSCCSSLNHWLWHEAQVSQLSWADQLEQMLLYPMPCLMCRTSLRYKYSWMCGTLHLADGPAWAGACLRHGHAKQGMGEMRYTLLTSALENAWSPAFQP